MSNYELIHKTAVEAVLHKVYDEKQRVIQAAIKANGGSDQRIIHDSMLDAVQDYMNRVQEELGLQQSTFLEGERR